MVGDRRSKPLASPLQVVLKVKVSGLQLSPKEESMHRARALETHHRNGGDRPPPFPHSGGVLIPSSFSSFISLTNAEILVNPMVLSPVGEVHSLRLLRLHRARRGTCV